MNLVLWVILAVIISSRKKKWRDVKRRKYPQSMGSFAHCKGSFFTNITVVYRNYVCPKKSKVQCCDRNANCFPLLLVELKSSIFVLLQTVVLKVGMSCEGCAGAVRRVLGKMEGLGKSNFITCWPFFSPFFSSFLFPSQVSLIDSINCNNNICPPVKCFRRWFSNLSIACLLMLVLNAPSQKIIFCVHGSACLPLIVQKSLFFCQV